MKISVLPLLFMALQGCSAPKTPVANGPGARPAPARKIPYPKPDRSFDAAADRFFAPAGGTSRPNKPADQWYVLSPYAPDRGYIDVRAFPSGSRILCPFTGRPFRIP